MAIDREIRIDWCRRGGRLALLAGSLALAACAPDDGYHRHVGETMGTEYAVTWAGGARCTADVWHLMEAELLSVNAQMSTWLPGSELSRFNRGPADRWVPVSEQLAAVVAAALELSRLSGGAFDVTVGPLVNLWGFGPAERVGLPTPAEIERAQARVGYGLLEVRLSPPALRKRIPDLYVDLSAIAKGHGVDRLASVLDSRGCRDYLVDIGGEIRVGGMSPAGAAWKVGVETPEPHGRDLVQPVLVVSDQAVATSGEYRNYRLVGDTRTSHTIDPRTGRPVVHDMASVTVVAASAILADGLATAINVLGPVNGLKWAEERQIAALALIRTDDGYKHRYTDSLGYQWRGQG